VPTQRSANEFARALAACRDEHVDDLPVLVYRPVHVPLNSVDLHVRLIDVPPVAGRVAGKPGGIGQQWGEPLHPPEDGDVVYLDAALAVPSSIMRDQARK
jgi:hypothetical protein